MKRLVISIVLLLFVTFVFAQQTTTIYGNYKNGYHYYNRTELKILWLDTETLTLKKENLRGEIQENGDFSFQTDKIVQPYTQCWLHLGHNSTQLWISPGDSIYMLANRPIFNESIAYHGIGAGVNNFRRDVKLNFSERQKEINKYADPIAFLDSMSDLYNKKIALLDTYFSDQTIDSAFYAFEKENLRYDYYFELVQKYNRERNPEQARSSFSDKIDSIIAGLDFQNQELLKNNTYRVLITILPDTKNVGLEPGTRRDMAATINFAENYYHDKIKQYYLSYLIESLLENAISPVEEHVLLKHLKTKFDHPTLIEKIEKHQEDLSKGRRFSGNLFEAGTIISALIIGFMALLFIIINFKKITGIKGVRINGAKWLKYAIYLVVLILCVIILEESHGGEFLKIFYIMIISGVVFLVHTLTLIPKIALKKKYRYYSASLLLIYLLLLISFNTIINDSGYYAFFISGTLLFTVGLMAFSWINYFVHLIAIGKTSLAGLFKEKYINLEIVFNLLLLFVVIGAFNSQVRYYSSLFELLTFYTVILLFYLQALIIIPRFLKKEKLVHLLLSNVLLLVILAFLMIITNAAISYAALKNIGVGASLADLISLRGINVEKLIASLFIIIPAFAYSFIKKQIQNQESAGFRLFRKKEAELAHLRSQVNPHFLFNTLNTLYAFALTEKSDRTAECIAKLANLMRFMIDDMEKEFIPLQKEVSYIQDYIKLQSIRSSVEHAISINVDMEDQESYTIAPMLLIPFVENAFKHGMNPNQISQLNIDIKAAGKKMQFVIENSVDNNFEAYYKEKGFGIGIENVKNRLEHIYPGQHNISIAKTDEKFIVIIAIETTG